MVLVGNGCQRPFCIQSLALFRVGGHSARPSGRYNETSIPREACREREMLSRACADSDVNPAAIPIESPPVIGTEDYLLGQQLWHQSPRDEEFDAGKEKADYDTIEMLRLAGSGTSSREIAVVLDIAQYGAGQSAARSGGWIELALAKKELIDDALEHKLFSRKDVNQGTIGRAVPNWADLAGETGARDFSAFGGPIGEIVAIVTTVATAADHQGRDRRADSPVSKRRRAPVPRLSALSGVVTGPGFPHRDLRVIPGCRSDSVACDH